MVNLWFNGVEQRKGTAKMEATEEYVSPWDDDDYCEAERAFEEALRKAEAGHWEEGTSAQAAQYQAELDAEAQALGW